MIRCYRKMVYFPVEKQWYSCPLEQSDAINRVRNKTEIKNHKEFYQCLDCEFSFMDRYHLKSLVVPRTIWSKYPQVEYNGGKLLFLDDLLMCYSGKRWIDKVIKRLFFQREPNCITMSTTLSVTKENNNG